jgi:hypothetical protein
MILNLVKLALSWLASHAKFDIYTSQIPVGHRFGGHDIPGITDAYIVLVITIAGNPIFTGCWQTA